MGEEEAGAGDPPHKQSLRDYEREHAEPALAAAPAPAAEDDPPHEQSLRDYEREHAEPALAAAPAPAAAAAPAPAQLPAAATATFSFAPRGQAAGTMQQLGLGTATLKGEVGRQAVVDALRMGYRLLDTALLYDNQEAVGQGLRESGVPREEVFLTSKVSFFPPGAAEGKTWMFKADNVKGGERASIDRCLQLLQTDYVDLLLIHCPCVSTGEYNAACMPHMFELAEGSERQVRPLTLPDGDPIRPMLLEARRAKAPCAPGRGAEGRAAAAAARAQRAACWATLEAAQRQGKCKHIGVSNYPAELLLEMREYATVMPAVNQLELHPRYASPQLREVAASLGCVLTGYGSGNSVKLEQSAVVAGVAERTGRSPTQVVLRWTIQHGVAAIPRSKTPAHMAENMDIFDWSLSVQDMAALDALEEDYPYYWWSQPTIDTCVDNVTAQRYGGLVLG